MKDEHELLQVSIQPAGEGGIQVGKRVVSRVSDHASDAVFQIDLRVAVLAAKVPVGGFEVDEGDLGLLKGVVV